MSDLIRREDAVSAISDLLMIQLQGKRLPTWNEVYNAINDIPSAEPERTAKVEHHGTISYPFHHCGECGREVKEYDCYCSGCGARLEWK